MRPRLTTSAVVVVLLLLAAAVHAQGIAPQRTTLFVGAHLGMQALDVDYREPEHPQFAVRPDVEGIAGGVLGGYDFRFPAAIVGIEGDIGWVDVDLSPGDEGGNRYTALEVRWNGHLRGKAGLRWNRAVLFGAAGFTTMAVAVDDVDPGYGEVRRTHTGWTAGGGLDYTAGRGLRFRGEYLFDRYGTENYRIESPPGPFFPAYRVDVRLRAHTLRAALVYAF